MASLRETFSQFFERKADLAVERIDRAPTNKLILIVLVLFSVGTVVIGAIQVKVFLDQPFFDDKLVEDKGKIRGPLELLEYIREQQKTNAALAAMQQRDTDGDGLNDYQEMYVYRTNPYTQYTYAGGKTDKEIVENGEWTQTCPGGVCNTNSSQDAPPTADYNDLMPANISIPDLPTGQSASFSTSEELSAQLLGSNGELSKLTVEQRAELKQYFQSMTVQDLRQMLLQQGFAQEKVNAMSDQELSQALSDLLSILN